MSEQTDTIRKLVAEAAPLQAAQLLQDLAEGMVAIDVVAESRIREVRQDAVVLLASLNAVRKAARRDEIDQDEVDRRTSRTSHTILELVDIVEALADRADVRGPAAMPSAPAGGPAPSQAKFEKIFGRNNLQDLSWLERALQCAPSICRVVSPAGTGTGFLIPGGFVMTNNHVVPDHAAAAEATFEFNFEQDIKGHLKDIVRYDSAPDDGGFATSPEDELDCTIIRVADGSDGPASARWGALQLARGTGPHVEVGDPVSIIQHPNGGQKKICVTANEVIGSAEDKLRYMTDTLPGSSGAPVFNEKWEVVALHHAGGEILTNDAGSRFFANEGILISSIGSDPEFARFFADK